MMYNFENKNRVKFRRKIKKITEKVTKITDKFNK